MACTVRSITLCRIRCLTPTNISGWPRACRNFVCSGGAGAGGPLEIPTLYNGRHRTFFTYGYEGIWSFDPSPWVVEAVPTAAMRGGDFSSLLAQDARYQIYDPFSIQPAANGRFSRLPLASNKVSFQPD